MVRHSIGKSAVGLNGSFAVDSKAIALMDEVSMDLARLGAASLFPIPETEVEIREFLRRHRDEVLIPLEWPIVVRAWDCTRKGWSRELVDLDQEWSRIAMTQPWAEASFQVGRRQLNRWRSLRDHRVIQRYQSAIELGTAKGWHPLVFGMMVALFNIPLRQGMMQFADAILLKGLERHKIGLVEAEPLWLREHREALRLGQNQVFLRISIDD